MKYTLKPLFCQGDTLTHNNCYCRARCLIFERRLLVKPSSVCVSHQYLANAGGAVGRGEPCVAVIPQGRTRGGVVPSPLDMQVSP
jgi:hypothetical protein